MIGLLFTKVDGWVPYTKEDYDVLDKGIRAMGWVPYESSSKQTKEIKMNNELMLIVSHKHCNDGLMAAHIARRALDASIDDIYFLDHKDDKHEALEELGFFNKIKEAIDNGTVVKLAVVDITLPAEIAHQLYEMGVYEMLTIDHHITNRSINEELYIHYQNESLLRDDDENGKTEFYKTHFDESHSAAYLAWAYFFGGEVPKPVLYIQDRDIWLWEFEENSRPFTQAFSMKCKTLADVDRYFYINHNVVRSSLRMTELHTQGFIGEGQSVLDYSQSCIDKDKLNVDKIKLVINGVEWVGGLVNCSSVFTSDLANQYLTENNLPFVICWQVCQNGIVKCGIRTDGNFDGTIVAKHFGGGGHFAAAGFRFNTLEGFLTTFYNHRKYGYAINTIDVLDLM